MLAWLLTTIWLRPLALPDEGRYAGVAWEMVRSGQWLTPTLDGLPYFHKPPMFYWLTALSIQLFGFAEWSVRLASLTGALVAAGATWRLMQRWVSPAAALWGIAILATLPFFYGGAQYANHDMLVAGFITGAIAFGADALLSREAGLHWRVSLLLAWACMALGLLSKGLIGIVLPSGVIFFWLLLNRRPMWLLRLFWWPAPLLFFAIAAPWFVLMQLKFPEFFDYFFIHQHFERFSQKGFNNKQPFWFYPVALSALCLPWTIALVTRIRLGSERDLSHRMVRVLLWTWVAVILLFFSLPASKLIGYALPAVPALAALAGEAVAGWQRRRLRLALAVFAALLCVVAVALISRAETVSSKALAAAWRAQAKPEDGLLSLRLYRFDFPIYAQLQAPLPVYHAWEDPSLAAQDSWPRELIDATEFDPATGKQVLRPVSGLRAALCEHELTWVIARKDDGEPLLKDAATVAENELYALKRVERTKLSCR
jgi:4-amino-4-deoxy-L-arabinose transferase-like glycosyltransferase